MHKRIGILHRLYIPTASGRIKTIPEDFIVEEIWDHIIHAKKFRGLPINQEVKGKGDYLCFTLEKKDWDTHKLLNILARRLGISKKRFSIAGTKDKFALTSQRVSAWHISPEALKSIKLRDAHIYDFEYGDKIELGAHQGNFFTITIRDLKGQIKKIKKFANFYGPQRFGMRQNNHLVGKAILQGNLEKAARIYLCDTYNEQDLKAKEARNHLNNNWPNFKAALKKYPVYLRYERAILHHLVIYPNDFANAFRKLPKGIFKIFVHAYQSYLFNLYLSEKIQQKTPTLKDTGPIIGYGVDLDKLAEKILRKEGITQEDFNISHVPEASGKGEYRHLILPLPDLKISKVDGNTCITFSLPAGAYASIVLDHLLNIIS
jgi:tRNA pseudouridine13 synthase